MNKNSLELSDLEYLNAPIVDIAIVQGSDPIPKGYHKIHTTVSRKRADLNNSAGVINSWKDAHSKCSLAEIMNFSHH